MEIFDEEKLVRHDISGYIEVIELKLCDVENTLAAMGKLLKQVRRDLTSLRQLEEGATSGSE